MGHGATAWFWSCFGSVSPRCVPIPLLCNDNVYSVPLYVGNIQFDFWFYRGMQLRDCLGSEQGLWSCKVLRQRLRGWGLKLSQMHSALWYDYTPIGTRKGNVVVQWEWSTGLRYVNVCYLVDGTILRRTRRYGLIEEGISLGWALKTSKEHTRPTTIPLSAVCLWIRCKLSARAPVPFLLVCLPCSRPWWSWTLTLCDPETQTKCFLL